MYNMQAIVRRSINNMSMQYEKLGYIANNISNSNTNAYKTTRFEQLLREDGCLDGAIRTNAIKGGIRISTDPYSLAIDGHGYFPVISPEGEVQYTRDGSFKRGINGYLMTSDDWMVGDGIKIPANCYKLEIRQNGEVMSYDKAGSLPEKIGTIPVVEFDSPESLEQGHNNKMVYTAESGMPRIIKEDQGIRQYAIEASNTSIYDEINDMMRLNSSMIASMNLMKVANDMYSKSINITE